MDRSERDLKFSLPESVIRAAVIVDAAGISCLADEMGYGLVTFEETRDRLESILQDENSVVLVCLRDNQLSGWIHGFVTQPLASEAFVEIGSLLVDAGKRRCGIGSQLLEHAQRWAKDRNKVLRVRCNANRKGSLAFYRSCGFEMIKNQQVFVSR